MIETFSLQLYLLQLQWHIIVQKPKFLHSAGVTAQEVHATGKVLLFWK
jgi:hypothetical protein